MGAASAVAEIKVAPKAKAAPGAMSSPTYGMVDLLAVRGMVVVMKHPHWEIDICRLFDLHYPLWEEGKHPRTQLEELNFLDGQDPRVSGRLSSSSTKTCDLVIGIEQVTKTSGAIPSP